MSNWLERLSTNNWTHELKQPLLRAVGITLGTRNGMSKLNGLPKYRPGIARFAAAEQDVSKKARRFSIARIEGRLRGGSVWRVTEDIFTARQADRAVEQLNRLELERSETRSDSCIVLNVDTLKAYLCPLSKAKGLRPPELIVD